MYIKVYYYTHPDNEGKARTLFFTTEEKCIEYMNAYKNSSPYVEVLDAADGYVALCVDGNGNVVNNDDYYTYTKLDREFEE